MLMNLVLIKKKSVTIYCQVLPLSRLLFFSSRMAPLGIGVFSSLVIYRLHHVFGDFVVTKRRDCFGTRRIAAFEGLENDKT